MTTVRRAARDDLPAILRMSQAFYATTEYAPLVPYDEGTVEQLATIIIDHHLFLVAENPEGAVVGMVGMMYAPFSFNAEHKMCAEVVWYVDPAEQRNGVGAALLDAIEPEGAKDDATVFQMFILATSPAFAGEAYLRRGYVRAGQSFLKVV
jgi:GNAT superfamily N-acetyltransferase